MKIIRAVIRHRKLTHPEDRRDLDNEIADGNETCRVLVIVLDRVASPRSGSIGQLEAAVRDWAGLPTVAP